MHSSFALKPENVIGLNFGAPNFYFLKRNKINFLVYSIHSSLNLLNLNNLLIRAKSPFLHHSAFISHILSIRNRTLVIIKNTIHILDYLLPITRFSIFLGKFLFFLTNGHFFLIYDNQNKIKLINPWTLKLIGKIKLTTEAIDIQIENFANSRDFLLVLNIKKNIELWDLKKKTCIIKFYYNCSAQIVFFKYLNKPKVLVFGINNGDLIFYTFSKINKILEIKKKIGIILDIFDSSFRENSLIIRSNKYLLLFNVLKNSLKKIKKVDNYDKLYCIESVYNFFSFFKFKIYEKKINLYRYYYGKRKIELIVSRIGNKFPIEKLKSDLQSQSFFVCASLSEKIYILKYDYFKNLVKLNSKIEKKKKLKIKEIQFKYVSFNQRKLYLAICFYKLYKPVIFKICNQKTVELDINLPSTFAKCGKSISICFSNNTNCLLVGYEKNCVSLLNLNNGKYLFVKKNHTFNTKKNNCKVISLSYDKNSEFFVTGCICGTIILWNSSKFLKINFLEIKKKIYFIKWCQKSDLIIIITIDNEILIVFSETFSIIGKFSGHKKKINDFLVLKKSKFLVTSSFDKTIKIWNFVKNKCEFSLRFLYSPVSLVVDKDENILISSHQFTLGLGLFQIYKKSIDCDTFEYFKNTVEKNAKLLVLKKKKVNLLSFKVLKNRNKRIYKKKNKFIETLKISEKKVSINNKVILYKNNFIKKISLNYFNFCLFNCNQLKILFKIQLKKSNKNKNTNIIFFFFEFFLDTIVYDLKIEKWLFIFPFFSKNIIKIIKKKKLTECCIKRMLIESNRKYLKYINFYH
nr:WD repeat-containing protein 13 [Cryptomonas curvata]